MHLGTGMAPRVSACQLQGAPETRSPQSWGSMCSLMLPGVVLEPSPNPSSQGCRGGARTCTPGPRCPGHARTALQGALAPAVGLRDGLPAAPVPPPPRPCPCTRLSLPSCAFWGWTHLCTALRPAVGSHRAALTHQGAGIRQSSPWLGPPWSWKPRTFWKPPPTMESGGGWTLGQAPIRQ